MMITFDWNVCNIRPFHFMHYIPLQIRTDVSDHFDAWSETMLDLLRHCQIPIDTLADFALIHWFVQFAPPSGIENTFEFASNSNYCRYFFVASPLADSLSTGARHATRSSHVTVAHFLSQCGSDSQCRTNCLCVCVYVSVIKIKMSSPSAERVANICASNNLDVKIWHIYRKRKNRYVVDTNIFFRSWNRSAPSIPEEYHAVRSK